MRIKVIKVVLITLIACSLVTCGNVKDMTFTKDNQDRVMEKVRNSKDLTGAEVGLLMSALMRASVSQESLEGKTVGQLIKEQKVIVDEAAAKEKEAKRLAEEAQKKEAEVAAQLLQYINVACYKKSFHKADIYSGDYQDTISVSFVFENKGNKDIKAFKGETTFKDLFGALVYASNLMYDQGVKVGEKKQWAGSIKYNQFSSELQKFRDTDLENMKFEWRPSAIVFTDGSRLGLEAPQQQ
jgi:hypothetical protein